MVLLSSEVKQLTLRELEETLKQRFGDNQLASRYRAELRTRRRRKGESLQALYNDISRLVTLAHPGPPSDLKDRLAVEAFIDSLDDQWLEEKVADSEPASLGQAYRKAVKSEANRRDRRSGDRGGERLRERAVRSAQSDVESDEEASSRPPAATSTACAVAGHRTSGMVRPADTTPAYAPKAEKAGAASVGQELKSLLEAQFLQMQQFMTGLVAGMTPKMKGGSSGGNSQGGGVTCAHCNKRGHVASECRTKAREEGRTPARVDPSQVECFRCHQKGHFKRDCTKTVTRVQQTGAVNNSSQPAASQ
jgi:hypothetical protein